VAAAAWPVAGNAPGIAAEGGEPALGPGAISGVVRNADGRPVASVDVRLLPAGLLPALPADRSELDPDEWLRISGGLRPHLRERVQHATTDERGCFLIEGLEPGSYDLLTTTTAGLRAWSSGVLVRAEETARVVLELPPPAHVFGRVDAPPATDLSELAVQLVVGDPGADCFDLATGSGMRPDFVRAPIAADGTFRFDPLPGGLYSPRVVVASWDPPTILHWHTPREGRNGWLRLQRGDNDLGILDAAASLPARIEIRVTRSGEPAPGATIVAHATSSYGVRSARTDEDGRVRIGPLPPGTYALHARCEGTPVVLPGPLVLEPGEEARLAFDVRTFPGSLRVLDAKTGELLPDQDVLLFLVPPWAGGAEQVGYCAGTCETTDGEGVVRFELAEGTYCVLPPMTAEEIFDGWVRRPPRIRWTAEGPVPAEIRLPSVRGRRRR